MADNTSIEWTGATWNIVTGCSVVSPGCTNCYAMRLAGTRLRNHFSREGLTTPSKAGPVWNGQTRVNWEWIDQPLSWARARDIFVCAHGDLFHESVAWEDIATIYGVMIAAHHLRGHRFQVLTKRSSRARMLLNDEMFWDVANSHAGSLVMDRVDPLDRHKDDARATLDDYAPDSPPPGIWLGVSVEDRTRLLQRTGDLRQSPAALRFLSCEPLIGDLGDVLLDGIDWVICGGESGPGARPMHPDWARSLRDQCAAAGVSFFFKQWGAWTSIYDRDRDDPDWRRCPKTGDWDRKRWLNLAGGQGFHGEHLHMMQNVGKKAAGRTLDGVIHNAMPEAAHG